MKILHTADWHLGKKIEGKSMLCNQKSALIELEEICDREKPDAIVVAGDIFDTAVPPADAEELFYLEAERLAKNRIFVAIAGNHDDELRLCAARSLAKKHNIFLIGDLDNSFYASENVEAGEGWLKIQTNAGKLNLALLPYPTEQILGGDEDSFENKVVRAVNKCCACFEKGEANVLVTHLYSGESDSEQMLGGTRILPKTIFPINADYCAVGHVHKPMTISKSRNAYYSGSLVPCSFDETETRSVNMVTIDGSVSVEKIQLANYKRLVRITANSYDEAFEKLQNETDYVEILYNSNQPVDAMKMGKLRALPSFLKFSPCAVRENAVKSERRKMTDEQLFEAFYESKKGKKPDDESVEMFVKAVKGESVL